MAGGSVYAGGQYAQQGYGQRQVPAYSSYYNQKGYNYQYGNYQKGEMKADFVKKVEVEKKMVWLNYVFLAILILGVGMVGYGFMATQPQKVSDTLEGLGNEKVTVAIICDPCLSSQENALVNVVGYDNYMGQVDNKFFARANSGEIEALAKQQWVKFITRVN